MNVLIVNDDEITAPGLWALARELKQVAEVLVAAPNREQTGVGTSLTLHQPIYKMQDLILYRSIYDNV